MARESRPCVTLHPSADVYQERGQLVTQVPTKVVWCHNVYNLAAEEQNLFIVGGAGKTIGTYMVDFTFYRNVAPYKEVQRVTVPSGTKQGNYWECGLLLEDKRKDKPKQDAFLLAAMFFKNLSAAPIKIVKFTRKPDGEKQWADEVSTSAVMMSDNKKDIV